MTRQEELFLMTREYVLKEYGREDIELLGHVPSEKMVLWHFIGEDDCIYRNFYY